MIHSPNEPGLENAIVDLYLRHEIRLVEASAFLGITLPLVRYRVSGIYKDEAGNIVTPNNVIAKVSRVEVAAKFFAPPPSKMLQELVGQGVITAQQAEWASQIPVARDLTSEPIRADTPTTGRLCACTRQVWRLKTECKKNTTTRNRCV